MYFDLIADLSSFLLARIREWRTGPKTNESRALEEEIRLREVEIGKIRSEVKMLEKREFDSRPSAKLSAESWWNSNRAALIVNVVAGLIVGLPIFVLGIVVTLVLT